MRRLPPAERDAALLGAVGRPAERTRRPPAAPARRPIASMRKATATSMPSSGARNRPVWLSGVLATCSGEPSTMTLPAAVAAFGTEVDDPVGRLHHVEVVLDHEHGVAVVDQALQHAEQPAHVLEVEAGGGLVEDVERAPGGALAELGRQLHPLRLATRQRGRGLAEAHVAEADVDQRLQVPGDGGLVGEELERPPRSTARAPRRCSCP